MKTTLRMIIFLCGIILSTSFSCEKDSDDLSNSTIGEIVSIFEVNYLETKYIDVGNQILTLTVEGLIDSVNFDCSLVDFSNNVDGPEKIKIHSYIQINGINSLIKVS